MRDYCLESVFRSRPRETQEVGGTVPLPSSPAKVLVAESDDIVLALISHILHRQGFAVDVAASVEDATRQMSSGNYRAIVIDAKLSGALDGLSDHSRVILLASHSTNDDRVHAVIQKPVEFGLLVDTVAACVK